MKKDVVVGLGEIGKPVTDKFVNNVLDLFKKLNDSYEKKLKIWKN